MMFLLYFFLRTVQRSPYIQFAEFLRLIPTMSRFEVLKYNTIYLRWLGYRPYRSTEQTNEFFRSFLSYFTSLATICFVLSSIAFSYKYFPDLELMSVSCITALGGFQSVCMFLSFGMKMKKIKEVHVKLQKLVDDEGNLEKILKTK